LAVTVHLEDETNICSKLMECVEFNEKHIAVHLADMLPWDTKSMEDWL